MKLEIKSIWGSPLFEGDFSTLAEAVSAVIKQGADLTGANLTGANLTGANLYGANLTGADLCGADLTRANLARANLPGADLARANLTGANLYGADLYGANLYGANLYGANLTGADLTGADLTRANLTGANLYGANLSKEVADKFYQTRTILPEGDLVGYKKLTNGVIAKLSIPADAKRVGGFTGRKCRASYAIVLEGSGTSKYDSTFEYTPGARVEPREKFDDDVRDDCCSGIHFFITRSEAEAYL